ncbi:MAG TPA: DUF1573 domain-containing protein, partial [Verrucomicrobiae bacterium]|nr:DUF1573 domain-containing protein [Verrucomicrobiae bacterium]
WDATTKETIVKAGAPQGKFTFNFTNISSAPVTIMSVRTSCGCTTAHLAHMPWTVEPGTNGQIDVVMNLMGKRGTVIKTITVSTDKGNKMLLAKTIIRPFKMQPMSSAARAKNQKVAMADRQAVFRGECASCHATPAEGKYGKDLYDVACGICHESPHRATMVPDLHALKVKTDFNFWRTWITNGKPGTLMPAFSSSQGGILNDAQINSLAAYLAHVIPSKPVTTQNVKSDLK